MSISLDTTNSLLGGDLTLAKLYLGIKSSDTSKDDIITQSCNSASAYCNTYTKRLLKSRTLTEYYSGDGSNTLYPDNYPITSITSIYDDLDRDYDSDSLIDADDLVVKPATEKFMIVYDGGVFTPGDNNLKITYVAGYTTIPNDLQNACLAIMATIFYSSEEKRLGMVTQSAGAGNITYEKGFPQWAMDILEGYKRKW